MGEKINFHLVCSISVIVYINNKGMGETPINIKLSRLRRIHTSCRSWTISNFYYVNQCHYFWLILSRYALKAPVWSRFYPGYVSVSKFFDFEDQGLWTHVGSHLASDLNICSVIPSCDRNQTTTICLITVILSRVIQTPWSLTMTGWSAGHC